MVKRVMSSLWSYSDIKGKKLDAGQWSQGEHTIEVYAYAANGAWSSATGTFEIALLSEEKNVGGCVECKTCPHSAHPIDFATGNKYQRERDLDLGGPGLSLGFTRYYNSRREEPGPFGYGWTTSYSESLSQESGKVILHQADGREVHFIEESGGRYVSETDRVRVIEPLQGGGFRLLEPDGKTLLFDASGALASISDRNGNTQTLTYEGGRVVSVEDNYGRRLEFGYDQEGRLSDLSTPVGVYTYLYDALGNLTRVTHPDSTTRSYLYEDPNDPHNLTGIINENNVRAATYAYDEQDRAVRSELAGGLERVSVVYDDNFVRHVTDSLGRTTTFKLYVSRGIGRVKTSTGEGCTGCPGGGGKEYTFTDRFQVESSADALGNLTSYTYDERGNVLSRTEAVGTSFERTTLYTYDPDLNLVTSITRQSVADSSSNTVTTFRYDERGNLIEMSERGFSGDDAVTRTTTYVYDGLGRLTRIDGPRSDVEDVTVLEYYPNTPEQGLNRGRLKKVTDALGHETIYAGYNGFGKPGMVTDANGVVVSYVYDAMGRVKSKTRAGATTTFEYDAAGNMTGVHFPGGRDIAYTYTEAGLLESIEDDLGNRIEYTYDSEGNRIREEVLDRDGALKRFEEFEFDEFNRLKRIIHPDGTFDEYQYDAVGNLKRLTDPNEKATLYDYDPLNRLTSVTQPGDVITTYGYDAHDNLVMVRDAEDHVTTYLYDDLGGQIRVASPESGSREYSYDEAGNLVRVTDAGGITVTYTYDALNRLTAVHYPESSQDVTFTYDQGDYGKGRLTGMVDPSGVYTYTYDAMGNIVREEKVIEGTAYSTTYTYDATGILTGITYPDGRSVTYELDGAGRVSSVSTARDGVSKVLAEDIDYYPFGPLKALTLGNGVVQTRTYDQQYRISRLSYGSVSDLSYTLDPSGLITGIRDNLDSARSKTFSYDDLHRLTRATGPYGTIEYTYDRVGNRLTRDINGRSETYVYAEGSSRLKGITGPDSIGLRYDLNGNVTGYGAMDLEYNLNNRLMRVRENGDTLGEYTYNGKGERIKKVTAQGTRIYHYDIFGNLIGESDASGSFYMDYVYLNNERLAALDAGGSREVSVHVFTGKGRDLSGIRVYVFTEAGGYTGIYGETDEAGVVSFEPSEFTPGRYKFRADYLSYMFWSEVVDVPGSGEVDVEIPEESATVKVIKAGVPEAGARVYLFNLRILRSLLRGKTLWYS
ncbi:MAG: RHS repeat protein [Deltaproteobacteria bacterium]|nr:RHS repeat protein [Deltaproteobacteria bacterium]